MRTLELFAGTQSFTKAVKRLVPSARSTTVDILPKFSPTIRADILTWDYTQFPPESFDVVWCSPPCTEYSKAKTRGVRDLATADACVLRCFEILDYLKPKVWILENPATGLLPKRMPTLRPGLSSFIADYCAYGAPYRKRTMFWSNIPLELHTGPGAGQCPSMDGTKHKGSCGNGTKTYNAAGIHSVWQKDAIPEPLVDYLALRCRQVVPRRRIVHIVRKASGGD